MALSPGGMLSHYRLVEKIGEGGMGVVWSADDTVLGRQVAIKVLPDDFAQDAERLARFKQEARLLAALNHPNIAAIHGLEESDGVRYLVLELVPGLTLAERIGRGPLPVDEALTVCRQIAEALEAAHEKGIIHRDLKPGNVKVTPDGKVKVLDFGLAKAFEAEAMSGDLSHSPTLTSPPTRAGVLLGTASYMSPEQARGKPLDKRTDIWSFGCVMYEVLTGRQTFGGETASDTIANILQREPAWDALSEKVPQCAARLLHRCLEKDSNRRLRDVWDVRIEIDHALNEPADGGGVAAGVQGRSILMHFVPWVVAGVLAIISGVAIWDLWDSRNALISETPLHLSVAIPENLQLGFVPQERFEMPVAALSPDGSLLAYVAYESLTGQLYLRSIESGETDLLPGTEGANTPFFSPDGQWLGFFAAEKLKKVPIRGGLPFEICDAPSGTGASWGSDDTIVFAPTFAGGLLRVSAAGGTPQVLTTLDSQRGEGSHAWPQILPGGRAALFTIEISGDSFDEGQLAVVSLDSGERRVVLEGGTFARYIPTGHLVYVRGGSLLAVAFDLERLTVEGSTIPVLEGISQDSARGAAHFTVSDDGTLLYVSGAPAGESVMVWLDRRGVSQPLADVRRDFVTLRISPDGQKVATTIRSADDAVWVYDISRGALSRLTFEGENFGAIWSADGERVAFSSDRAGAFNLFWKFADGSGVAERLLASEHDQIPSAWSPDGRTLVFTELHPVTGTDIWFLDLEGDRRPRPFLQTRFSEEGAVFSPDGDWLAYVTDESGRGEVYVQSYSNSHGKWQVSTEGGHEPVWARSGRELFYHNDGKMMMVSVQTTPAFSAGKPVQLFETTWIGSYGFSTFDVAPDGEHFAMADRRAGKDASPQLNIVLNWFEELKRLVPTESN
ncbi:MAG: protein kinase [Acidobacteriota bacterium]